MSGRKSKRKGAVGERELAAELTWVFNIDAHRGRQYHGGPGTPDVVAEIPGVHIECKRCEKLNLYNALEQARKDAPGDVPIVAHRKNRKDWVVITGLYDLPDLVRRLAKVMGIV